MQRQFALLGRYSIQARIQPNRIRGALTIVVAVPGTTALQPPDLMTHLPGPFGYKVNVLKCPVALGIVTSTSNMQERSPRKILA